MRSGGVLDADMIKTVKDNKCRVHNKCYNRKQSHFCLENKFDDERSTVHVMRSNRYTVRLHNTYNNDDNSDLLSNMKLLIIIISYIA